PQNGPGTPDVEETVYDRQGRVIWTKDGAGFLTYTAYDQASGAVLATITDVDTARTADFTGLPAGWRTARTGRSSRLVAPGRYTCSTAVSAKLANTGRGGG
ncbi:MAG: hypothetical protein ACJ8CN_10145, partial [Gemmatimonadales bacterium]